MSSTINRNSGSIYPQQSLIQDQIDPQGTKMWISSQLDGGFAPLPSKAYVDLTRYGTLNINGSVVYSPKCPINPGEGIQSADHVFRQMETKLDSTALAMRASSLMQQDTGGEVLKLISIQKGISKPQKIIHDGQELDSSESTHGVIERDRVILLNTDKSSFKLVMESLVEQRSMSDPEGDLTYFKVKTTVEGPKRALENKDGDKLSIKAAYTAESPTKEGALQDDYLGTRAGFWDSESYLKA